MDELKELAEAIVKNTKKNKTNAYETLATVLRIDGEKVYVHIDGGAPETPATATMACKEGDTVRIHVEGGRAWIIGNVSAPATDDTTAEEASEKIEAYKKYVNTIIREYEDGVLVCKAGKNIGALVNSSGSFDVVKVNWSGTTPEPSDVIATFSGQKIQIGKNKKNNILVDTDSVKILKDGAVVATYGEKVKIGGEENYIELIPNPSSTEDSLSLCVNGKHVTLKSSGDDVYSFITGKHIEFSIGDLTQAPYNIAVDSHSGGVLSIELLGSIKAYGRVTSEKESEEIQLTNGASGTVNFYRKGDIVQITMAGIKLTGGTNNRVIGTIPAGWRPARQMTMYDGTNNGYVLINSDGTITCRHTASTSYTVYAGMSYLAWD